MFRTFLAIVFSIVCLQSSAFAAISSGPAMELRVGQIYDSPAEMGGIYVTFPAGAMPGCNGNAGGILLNSATDFTRFYSLLLTMIAGKPIRGSVLYEITGQPTTSWAACYIKGFNLLPE